MAKRGRPRKIKKLEQYTLNELRDMPMGSMVRLFMSDLVGKRSVLVASPKKSIRPTVTDEKKESTVVSDLMGMTLEKKADYLADALMGYLKKGK